MATKLWQVKLAMLGEGDPSMPLDLEKQISQGNFILLAKG